MPRDAQALLEVLSVAAGPIEQGVAIEAAGLAHGDRGAMLALRAARLIRTRGTRQADKAETYHDRVRETVVGSMNGRRACARSHARIAHAMERYDIADPERMVVHYSGAGDGMRAGETAVQAAHTRGEEARVQPRGRAVQAGHRAAAGQRAGAQASCTRTWRMRWRMPGAARRRRRRI